MTLKEDLQNQILILDGAMGSELMARTKKPITFPEILNIEEKKTVHDIHKAYIEAGADIIETNTLGANRIKLNEHQASEMSVKLNSAAVEIAKQARGPAPVLIAGSIGPTGKLIQPLGDMEIQEAYDAFAEQAIALQKAGADLIMIETQIDVLEAKIALRAVKENTSLPVSVTLSFPMEGGQTVTGTDPETAAIIFSSLDADIFGINCGGHPDGYEDLILKIKQHSIKPLIVYANAGVPETKDGIPCFTLGPEKYAHYAQRFFELGANIIGGCCGVTTEHIRLISKRLRKKKPVQKTKKTDFFRAASRNTSLTIGTGFPFRIIGENINPFGRKSLREELKENKLGLVRKYAKNQEKEGADGLDVNFGKKGEKDPCFYASAINELQNLTKLPLFLDNQSPDSLELALKTYAGKAVINSVNGEKASYENLFPLAKKYGASVILLAMDESGIPETAEGRVKIIESLMKRAFDQGLQKEDLLVDPIILTISTSRKGAETTLRAIELLEAAGLQTIIGLSNLSFGLPNRKLLNAAFLPMAVARGLDSAICNPLDNNLMSSKYACNAIVGRDKGMHDYLEAFGETKKTKNVSPGGKTELSVHETLEQAVIDGDKSQVEIQVRHLLHKGEKGIDILENILMPALRQVGKLYEEKKYFLPQLILSAESMEAASTILEDSLKVKTQAKRKVKIVMATVKGDFHDIGKNIVCLVMKSIGYDVLDLGKNVSGEEIIRTALETRADFIGLSALMTSTMEEMKHIVALRDSQAPGIKIIVGGAAVSPFFALDIGADLYGKDPVDATKKMEELISEKR